MRTNFITKMAATAILITSIATPAWADYTITKADGTPAELGSDWYSGDYHMEGDEVVITTGGLVLSGVFPTNGGVVLALKEAGSITLKDATISNSCTMGALIALNYSTTLVLEGTNSIVSTSTGAALKFYSGCKELTITGEGSLYLTSNAKSYNESTVPCLFGEPYEPSGTNVFTAAGHDVQGSKDYNASIESLAEPVWDCYIVTDDFHPGTEYCYDTYFVGEDFCNTLYFSPKPSYDPNVTYVVVSNDAGVQYAIPVASDVKVEWKKGADIE